MGREKCERESELEKDGGKEKKSHVPTGIFSKFNMEYIGNERVIKLPAPGVVRWGAIAREITGDVRR